MVSDGGIVGEKCRSLTVPSLRGGSLIHIIREMATDSQIREMLEQLENYIKLAVDVRREILAGGGALHADCEAVLLEDGSKQEDVWGADWIPSSQEVRYEVLINLRPGQGGFSMELEDPQLREATERIVTARMGAA